MSTSERRVAQERPAPGNAFVPHFMIVVLFVATALTSLVVLYSLWAWWPDATRGGATPTQKFQKVQWLGWNGTVQRETLFFIVVALAGVLGGLIHTVRSLSWYVGNRKLRWSWVPFNLMLPIVGALGGTVFYLVLRAGLFSPSGSVDEASPFGFAAVSVLVGLFSEHAMEKLRQVAANVFAERPTGKDHVDPVEPTAAEEQPAAER